MIPVYDWVTVEAPDEGDAGIVMERAKVPGGWLVRATLRTAEWSRALQSYSYCDVSVSICFVPEPG